MTSKRNFFFAFFMLLATMWGFRFLSGDETNRSSVALSRRVPPPAGQRSKERIFKDFDSERRFCVGEGSRESMRGSLLAKVDGHGDLYVLDVSDLKIRRFSPQGKYLQTFGYGKGQAPEKVMSVSDFGVLSNGEVWIADLIGKKIEMLSPDGHLLGSIRPDRQPYRLLPGEKKDFTLMMPPMGEHLFGHFGADGRVQAEFGKLVDNHLDGLALDGWTEMADDGAILYVPYYFGWIASYSPSGDLKYIVKTIDDIPDPSIRRSSNGTLWMDPDTRVSANGASVSGGKLYVFAGNAAGNHFSHVVDVYDAGNGAYRYSFETPEAGAMALVRDDSLYMVKDTSVCQWSLRPTGETLRAAR